MLPEWSGSGSMSKRSGRSEAVLLPAGGKQIQCPTGLALMVSDELAPGIQSYLTFLMSLMRNSAGIEYAPLPRRRCWSSLSLVPISTCT